MGATESAPTDHVLCLQFAAGEMRMNSFMQQLKMSAPGHGGQNRPNGHKGCGGGRDNILSCEERPICRKPARNIEHMF